MEDLKKNTNFQKLGDGRLPRDGRFPGTLLYLCENLGVKEERRALLKGSVLLGTYGNILYVHKNGCTMLQSRLANQPY